MNNKIPPPLVMLAAGVLMWFVSRSQYDVGVAIPFGSWLARVCVTLGAAVALIAAWQFRSARTTIDPLNPQNASSLVSGGIFHLSRNPMYLGMALILLGIVIKLGSLFSLLILMVFVGLITQFQIKPEERALTEIFGQSYTDYCNQVRRWL